MKKTAHDFRIQKDASDQEFVEVGPVRITYVHGDARPAKKNWPGQSVLRVQAYVGKGKQLHQGAEIPIEDPITAWDVVAAICLLCRENVDVVKSKPPSK